MYYIQLNRILSPIIKRNQMKKNILMITLFFTLTTVHISKPATLKVTNTGGKGKSVDKGRFFGFKITLLQPKSKNKVVDVTRKDSEKIKVDPPIENVQIQALKDGKPKGDPILLGADFANTLGELCKMSDTQNKAVNLDIQIRGKEKGKRVIKKSRIALYLQGYNGATYDQARKNNPALDKEKGTYMNTDLIRLKQASQQLAPLPPQQQAIEYNKILTTNNPYLEIRTKDKD